MFSYSSLRNFFLSTESCSVFPIPIGTVVSYLPLTAANSIRLSSSSKQVEASSMKYFNSLLTRFKIKAACRSIIQPEGDF